MQAQVSFLQPHLQWKPIKNKGDLFWIWIFWIKAIKTLKTL